MSVCGLFRPPQAIMCQSQMSVRRKRLYHGIGNYVWGRCTAMEWRVWYLLVSAVRLSCLQSSGAIERLGGPQNTPQWHHNIVPGRLPAYWKTQGRNFFMPEIGAVRILLRKTLQCDASNGRQATRPDATWCESAVKRNLQKQTHTHTHSQADLSVVHGEPETRVEYDKVVWGFLRSRAGCN